MFSPFKKYALMMTVSVLTGCTTMQPNVGNFTEILPAADEVIATDAVSKMVELYPPAKTELVLQHPATDSFGIIFISTLRGEGYALAEYAEPDATEETADEIGQGDLSYILDNIADTELYLLKIKVGNSSITRPYKMVGETVTPAGYWVQGTQ